MAAYLSHVWEKEIAALDNRIWSLAMSKRPLLLHRHDMTLKWSESDRLPEPSGRALRGRILQFVGSSPTDYTARKAGLKNSSGHNTGRGRLTVRIPLPDQYRNRHPDEFLVDTLLGLTPFPAVIDGEMTHVEFRVPKTTTQSVHAGARLAVGAARPTATGELALATPDGEREVILPAEVQGPTGLAHPVDPSAWKVLFTVPLAQFLFSAGAKTGTFYFALPGWEDAQPLSKCIQLANLLKFLSEVDTPVTVSFNGGHWGTLDMRGGSIQEDFLAWARLVQVARAARTEFGFPLETPVTTRSLLEQQTALDSLAVALPGCSISDPAFTFSLRKGSPEPPVRTQMCFPICVDLTLGTRRAVVFESLIGQYRGEKTSDGSCVVHVERGELDKVIRATPGKDLPKRRKTYLDEIGQARAKDGGVLWWWRSDPEPTPTTEHPPRTAAQPSTSLGAQKPCVHDGG